MTALIDSSIAGVADKLLQGLFLGIGAIALFLVVVGVVLWLNRTPR